MIAVLDNRSLTDEIYSNTQRKTPDSSKWLPWRFDGIHSKSFPIMTRERECTIQALQGALP